MEKDEYYYDMNPLIRKNIEYAEKHLHLVGPSYEEDYGDIPEGCLACGGDYPLCRQGCPLYDED